MKKKKTSKPLKKKPVQSKKIKLAVKKKTVAAKKKVTTVKSKKDITQKKKVAAKFVKKVSAAKPLKKASAKKKPEPAPANIIAVPQEETKITASGRIRIQLEYFTRSSIGVLYNSFSNASGLAAWFADNVDVHENIYTFTWDGSQESAIFLEKAEDEYARFRWLSQPDDCYFEFRIKIDPITNEAALVITDFVEKGEEKEARLLWDSQVHELMHILGS